MNKIIPKRKSLVSEYVRTLLAAGYSVINSHRQPNHIEISCEYKDVFGLTLNYLFIFSEAGAITQQEISAINKSALLQKQYVVTICNSASGAAISYNDFFLMLGGSIPSWHALGADFSDALLDSSYNRIPTGYTGEAWLAFEEAVADGFEFIFGRRAIRLGGNKRGKRVSDIFIQLPDGSSLLIDTKATSTSFNASWPNLRALSEYTKDHLIRQSGYFPMAASILVAPKFKQKTQALAEIANDFLSETNVPLTFMTANNILEIIKLLSQNVILRNKINWKKLFRRNGLYRISLLTKEIDLLMLIIK